MTKQPTLQEVEIELYRQQRIKNIKEWGVTRRVPCPSCGAQISEDCHTEPGWYPKPDGHSARRKLAQQKVEERAAMLTETLTEHAETLRRLGES